MTRKFGSLRKNERQTATVQTSTFGSRFGSGKKDKNTTTSSTNGKIMTSSAKKIVLNSTSDAENVLPADWDASVINHPQQDNNVLKAEINKNKVFTEGGTTRRKLAEPMTNMKLKTTVKKNLVRGPLKAMPSTTVKPIKNPPKSVFKKLQASNTSTCSSNDEEDEGMALYDEYLLSKLMSLNVKQNCQEAKRSANKNILDLASSIQHIRSEVNLLI